MTKTQLRREKRKKKGKCPRCGSPNANPGDGRCYKCRARRAVYKAVKRKRLIKKPCQHPGCDVKQTEFHHAWGYRNENRYKGTWLCVRHHIEAHSDQTKPEGKENMNSKTTMAACLIIALISFLIIIGIKSCAIG